MKTHHPKILNHCSGQAAPASQAVLLVPTTLHSWSSCASRLLAIFLSLLGIGSAILAPGLQAQETRPDLAKLIPTPPCPALVAAARTNQIPVEGIDPPGEAGSFNPGDSLTALITLFEKAGRQTQWLLHVAAAGPEPLDKSNKTLSAMVLYVGAGDKLEFNRSPAAATLNLLGPFTETTAKAKPPKAEAKRARIALDKGFLSLGLDQAAAALYRMHRSQVNEQFPIRTRPFTQAEMAEGRKAVALLHLTASEQRALAGAPLALLSYYELVQQTPGLDRLFFKVVDLPSVWSMVRHVGIKATLDAPREQVSPADAVAWHQPIGTACYLFPLVLRLNDHPALRTTLVVVPPQPPLLACGGIVGVLAENPSDKDTYLTLRILSAHHQTEAGKNP